MKIPKRFRTPPPQTQTWFGDFETKPIGGKNPYHCCAHCGISVPEINYRLEGHAPTCAYRKAKESGQPYPLQK